MALLPIRRIVAVALVVVMTLSMGLSMVHASMSVEMAFSSAMGPSGQNRCQSCADDEADGIKAMPCAAAAPCVAFAMLPQAGPAALAGGAAILSLPEDDLLLGSTTRPDPYPPRSRNIG